MLAMSGLFAGLNLGLLSLDLTYLQIISKGPFMTFEDEKNAFYALKLLPLRQKGHLLLCTILIGNVFINSALAILLANITSGFQGLVLSAFLITVFAEIIPQAICSRWPLSIGAYTT